MLSFGKLGCSQENNLLVAVYIDNRNVLIVVDDLHEIFFSTQVGQIAFLETFKDVVDGSRLTVVLLTHFLDNFHSLGISILLCLRLLCFPFLTLRASKSTQTADGEVHELKGLVDVVHVDLTAEVDLSEGLGETNYAEQGSW